MSTYAYEQLVRAFRLARRRIETREGIDDYPSATDAAQAGASSVAEAIAQILADDDPKFDAEAFRREVQAHHDNMRGARG